MYKNATYYLNIVLFDYFLRFLTFHIPEFVAFQKKKIKKHLNLSFLSTNQINNKYIHFLGKF